MLALARVTLALATLAAIGQQLVVHVAASFSALNFFSYFTNLSNLFAALVLLLSVFTGQSRSLDIARFVSAVNMTVVGLVFAALLRNVDLGDLLPWVNFLLHYVMPLAIVVDWLVKPPVSRLDARHASLALVFPATYLAYVIVRGAATGWYPYPFLNPANVGGYVAVSAYACGIAVTFALAIGILRSVGNRRASS